MRNLQFLIVPVESRQNCQKSMPGAIIDVRKSFCAGYYGAPDEKNKDVCKGDSGGPLFGLVRGEHFLPHAVCGLSLVLMPASI